MFCFQAKLEVYEIIFGWFYITAFPPFLFIHFSVSVSEYMVAILA